jgi:hypothetical protein
MDNEILREEEAKKILNTIKDKGEIDNVAELIKDNKIPFKYKDKDYRVRLLNREDKTELNMLKIKKLNSLLKDKDMLMEFDLRKLYKEKGIDIEGIELHIKKLQSQLESVSLKQGEAIARKIEEVVLKEYTNQIKDLEEQIGMLVIQKTNLLKDSLENLLETYILDAMLCFALEQKTGDNWEKVFKTIEDFYKYEDEQLIITATFYNMLLQLHK